MREKQVVLATTHVGRDNIEFARSALESTVEQLETEVIPMWIEHDPRIPPHGRIIDAEVREREDGEHELIGRVETYEEEDLKGEGRIPLLDRTIPVGIDEDESGEIIFFNRTFDGEADQRDISEISEALNAEATREEKRSFELLPVLKITGKYALGAIATGFLGKIGADVYDFFKEKVKELMNRKAEETDERLLIFNPVVEVDGRLVEIKVILTNPTDEDIEKLFDDGLQKLDQILPKHITDNSVRCIVYKFEGQEIELRFGVRKDAAPLDPELFRSD